MCRYGCVRSRTQYSTLPSLWLCIYIAILCRTCVCAQSHTFWWRIYIVIHCRACGCIAVTYSIVCSLIQSSLFASYSYLHPQNKEYAPLRNTRSPCLARINAPKEETANSHLHGERVAPIQLIINWGNQRGCLFLVLLASTPSTIARQKMHLWIFIGANMELGPDL